MQETLKPTDGLGKALGLGQYGSDEDSDGSPSSKPREKNKKRRVDAKDSTTVKPPEKKPVVTRVLSLVGGYDDNSDEEGDDDKETKDDNQPKLNGQTAVAAVELLVGSGMVSAAFDFNEGDPVVPFHNLPLIRSNHPATEDYRHMGLLPPDPPTKPNPEVQKKIGEFMAKVKTMNLSFNESLLNQKDFHNPYILDKIAKMYDIDPRGSNYPRSLYDPLEITRDDLYDVIAGHQKFEEDKRAEERKKRTAVDFVPPRPTTPSRPLTPHQNPSGPTPPTTLEPVNDQIAAAKLKVKAVKATTAVAAAKAQAALIVQEIKDKEKAKKSSKTGKDKDTVKSGD